MKSSILLTLIIGLLCVFKSVAQTPVDVAENTLKIKPLGEEVFYYGFAQGDQLIFSFQEVNGKELKEIEVTELPSSSKFMDYKSKKIENKVFSIGKNCIYKFRLANGAIVGRICKFKIQRIPASESTQNFNTNVYWRTVYDTTYTAEQEKYLVKSDTSILNILSTKPKISSDKFGMSSHSVDYAAFAIPYNTVKLSYYIGVDEANSNAYSGALKEISDNFGSSIVKVDPQAAVALYGLDFLAKAGGQNAVQFDIVDAENEALWAQGSANYRVYKSGTRIREAGQLINPIAGNYYFLLKNRNNISAIEVMIEVSAVVVKEQWGMRPIQRMHISARQEAYLEK